MYRSRYYLINQYGNHYMVYYFYIHKFQYPIHEIIYQNKINIYNIFIIYIINHLKYLLKISQKFNIKKNDHKEVK